MGSSNLSFDFFDIAVREGGRGKVNWCLGEGEEGSILGHNTNEPTNSPLLLIQLGEKLFLLCLLNRPPFLDIFSLSSAKLNVTPSD